MIQKTKDKREQGDLLIATAQQIQEASGGKLPSVSELAQALNTSVWTVYHNPFYMDWFHEHDGQSSNQKQDAKQSSDARQNVHKAEKDFLLVNGQTIYPWEYHGERVVRNAEMEKCLSRAARDAVKECAKQNPDYQLQISLQELWNENPGCKRSGNPVFPIYVYTEPVFQVAQGGKKVKAQQKKELQKFIDEYFHAVDEEESEELETSDVAEETAESAGENSQNNSTLLIERLSECLTSGFQTLSEIHKAQTNESKALYEEICKQNILLTQAITLLSKDIVVQGKILQRIQDSMDRMQFVPHPIDPDSVTTATAKILNDGKKISETEKKSMIAEKLRGNRTGGNANEQKKQNPSVNTALPIPTEEQETAPTEGNEQPEWSEQSGATEPTVTEPTVTEPGNPSVTEPVPEFISFRAYSARVHALMSEFGYTEKMEPERRALLSKAYKRMRNNYGIVWEQLDKDYVQENGDKARSTMRLAYFLEMSSPKCRTLLESCLRTVLEEEKAEKEKVSSNAAEQYYIEDLDAAEDAIERMATAKNVNPRILKDEYHAILQSDTTMHWKRLSTSYREKFGAASKYVLDPMKIAKSTDKAKKRAIVLFNGFVDKQMNQDATA